ncbi:MULTISPECIES: hypothetical protein [unclassified Cupriavidus]|uniref:hypothetical protein n=1 Tax=unclassified Cupriavidus TaxID=2640874 RepID=UPI001C008895|nr:MULTISPECIES: hypothetical protein [unclassified Cupriavidus]MCA3188305.1 hypothetical protein [Cupriavidus sp.]MCA3189841.1 hypothetical protein [Cupriavidus sp.]MCA3196435.1 hypothetical protein [Cupriavidus sp.]MCA3202180.1 hypothetical protein [Cupriavidus sp.]QWE93319.1 hypothetical protein KLP38_09730 [Cupriavidus sp. EM10]
MNDDREYDVVFANGSTVNVIADGRDHAQEQAIDCIFDAIGIVPAITAIVRKPLGTTIF